jgi:hypothetical protein
MSKDCLLKRCLLKKRGPKALPHHLSSLRSHVHTMPQTAGTKSTRTFVSGLVTPPGT